MSRPFDQHSAAELFALCNDTDLISIGWRPDTDTTPKYVYKECYPKAVAQVFSPYCARQLRVPADRNVLITGGSFDHVKIVLCTIMKYCKGDRSLPEFSDIPFCNGFKLVEAARLIGVKVLGDKLWEKVKGMKHDLPTENDTRAVLKAFVPNDTRRQMMITAIAHGIVQGRLDGNKPSLLALATENPDFGHSLRAET